MKAFFIGWAHRHMKAGEPTEALIAMANAFSCRDITTKERSELNAIQRSICIDHPEAGERYYRFMEKTCEDEMAVIRNARKGR